MGGGVCAAGILKRASYRNSLWVSCGGGGARYRQNFLVIPSLERRTGHGPTLLSGYVGSRSISMFRNFRRNFRRRSSDFLPPFPSIIVRLLLGIINA